MKVERSRMDVSWQGMNMSAVCGEALNTRICLAHWQMGASVIGKMDYLVAIDDNHPIRSTNEAVGMR